MLLLVHGPIADRYVDCVGVVVVVMAGIALVMESTGLPFYVLVVHVFASRVLGDDVPGVEETWKEA